MKTRIGKAAAVAMIAGSLTLGSVSLGTAGLGEQNSYYQRQSVGQKYHRGSDSRNAGSIQLSLISKTILDTVRMLLSIR